VNRKSEDHYSRLWFWDLCCTYIITHNNSVNNLECKKERKKVIFGSLTIVFGLLSALNIRVPVTIYHLNINLTNATVREFFPYRLLARPLYLERRVTILTVDEINLPSCLGSALFKTRLNPFQSLTLVAPDVLYYLFSLRLPHIIYSHAGLTQSHCLIGARSSNSSQ